MRVFTRRELGRVLLACDLLLERSALDPLAALRHLVGVQAQEPQEAWPGPLRELARTDDVDVDVDVDAEADRVLVALAPEEAVRPPPSGGAAPRDERNGPGPCGRRRLGDKGCWWSAAMHRLPHARADRPHRTDASPRSSSMLFHARMDVAIPRDLDPHERIRLLAAEQARALALQRAGTSAHPWRVVAQDSDISVFDGADGNELHEIRRNPPLFPPMCTTLTPPAEHPAALS